MTMAAGVKLIRVAGFQVGIVGLVEAFEEARRAEPGAREELAARLLELVKARNYVAPGFEEEYRKALVREYCRRFGLPFEEEPATGLRIQVLGPGCANCEHLFKLVQEVLVELNLPAELDHVRDPDEIARHGLIATPGLVVNGVVKAAGRVPPRARVRAWVEEAAKQGT